MRRILITTATLLAFFASAAFAADTYVNVDNDGNIVVSGPFNAVIPKPPGARSAGPVHASPSFLDEQLQISTAGYFADNQFVTVQVETTNAATGTLTNKNLPVVKIAGQEFRARDACIDISQEELDADDDQILEFVEDQNVQIVPAMQAVQLVVVNDDGTAEGTILFMRNVPGGCAAMTPEFKAEFDAAFERFITSIHATN
ncbi:MAG: hypothetical protein MUP90_04950 [Gammaproteobacteria bacterium]|nr:hypothetical protein [Gammaproteobacteria bacterium]